MSTINTILYVVNTNIYQYLRVQDGKNLQYTCKDIAQIIAELRNKPAFKSDPTGCDPFSEIYTEELEGKKAYLFGKPIDRPNGTVTYEVMYPNDFLYNDINYIRSVPKEQIWYNIVVDSYLCTPLVRRRNLMKVKTFEQADEIIKAITLINDKLRIKRERFAEIKHWSYEFKDRAMNELKNFNETNCFKILDTISEKKWKEKWEDYDFENPYY